MGKLIKLPTLPPRHTLSREALHSLVEASKKDEGCVVIRIRSTSLYQLQALLLGVVLALVTTALAHYCTPSQEALAERYSDMMGQP
jgi:hypothetical protein